MSYGRKYDHKFVIRYVFSIQHFTTTTIIRGFSYYIRHGYEYDDGDMRRTRQAMLLSHKIFKNRNNYLLTGVTHAGISTNTMSSMGEHQPFQE